MDPRRYHDREYANGHPPGVTPELAAAVTKLMSNKDLVLAANKVRVVTRCRNTMGQTRSAWYSRPA